MELAKEKLATAINSTRISEPFCPIYQNVDAQPYTDTVKIRKNLIEQLTSPVKWTQTILNMSKNGLTEFKELGPGNVLTNLIDKINNELKPL